MTANDKSQTPEEAFEAVKGGDVRSVQTVLEYLRSECEGEFRDDLKRRLRGRLAGKAKSEQIQLIKEYSNRVFKRAGADALILVLRGDIDTLTELVEQFRAMLRYGTLYIVITEGGL